MYVGFLRGTATNRFVGMPICNIPTGKNLFNVLETALSQDDIKWDSVKGFSFDAASVMVGVRNSVLSRIRKATNNSY